VQIIATLDTIIMRLLSLLYDTAKLVFISCMDGVMDA
jgi:hypothetical protein